MDYAEAKKLVKSRLSEKRWTHTKNVKKMAVKLAKRWGADPEKAAMAAILRLPQCHISATPYNLFSRTTVNASCGRTSGHFSGGSFPLRMSLDAQG